MLEMQATEPAGTPIAVSSKTRIAELVDFAAKGLPQMLDPQRRLFCYTLEKSPQGMVRKGISHRYTMMTLLGLHRLQASGGSSAVDIKLVLETLLRDTSWIQGAGDLGLLLWTCAELAPERLPEVIVRTHPAGALKRFADARRGYTMELAWFLAGVSHVSLAGCDDFPELTREGLTAMELLQRNCGVGGIYGHMAGDKSPAGWVRGRIGSFADQVYPIYALSKFAKAYSDERATTSALNTARTICRYQGPLGQWWWHYDSSRGRVAGRYAVYSVHQHAMAPMALFALAQAAQQDFSEPIFRGLDWIIGRNELDFDMRAQSCQVIWRSFYQSKYRTWAEEVLGLAGVRLSPGNLHVKYECRPYELGWLLYAWASAA